MSPLSGEIQKVNVSGAVTTNGTTAVQGGIVYNLTMPPPSTVSYRVGDEKWIEDNYLYQFRTLDQSGKRAELVDFFTLKDNNAFGNKNRFTDSVGGKSHGYWYISDFSSTGSKWVVLTYGGTTELDRTAPDGSTNCMVHIPGHSTNAYSYSTILPAYGELCHVEFDYYVPNETWSADKFSIAVKNLGGGSPNSSFTVDPIIKGSWQHAEGVLFDYGTDRQLRFLGQNISANYVLGDSNYPAYYLKNVKTTWYPDNHSLQYYIIDNYTGMGWNGLLQDSSIWDGAIDYSLGTDFGGLNNYGGYTNWFLPNIAQLNELRNGTNSRYPIAYDPFSRWDGVGYYYHISSSTPSASYSDRCLSLVFERGNSAGTKITARQYLICRKHF